MLVEETVELSNEEDSVAEIAEEDFVKDEFVGKGNVQAPKIGSMAQDKAKIKFFFIGHLQGY